MKPATISINTQFTYNRKLVLWATGMTDDELNYFIVETADTWLRHFFDGKINHDAILNSTGFWGGGVCTGTPAMRNFLLKNCLKRRMITDM
ncbi:MAG: hypothetical protein IPH58_05425 [Sphingobacteriales bacterium]|nr:hypothetical protein [Sphingobacteriales bacterium]